MHPLLEKTASGIASQKLLRALDLHIVQEEYAEAIACLLTIIEQGESSDPVLLLLAALYRLHGETALSLAMLRDLVARRPADADALYQCALGHIAEKNYAEALPLLERAHALAPARQEVSSDLAVILLVSGHIKRAMCLLETLVHAEPSNILLQTHLGCAYLVAGKLQAAMDLAQELPHTPETKAFFQQLRAVSAGHCDAVIIPGHQFEVPRMDMMHFDAHATSTLPLSLVIPLMNEESNVPILYQEICMALGSMEYEMIFIDDGSTDATRAILENLATQDKRVKVICFRRNYGQTAALSAGFKLAQGRIVVTLDGDLQNDPADIPRLLDKMSEGYDLVSGWRKDRKDTLITRKIPSQIANGIINHLISATGIQLHDFGCTLKAYKSEIVKNINLYGEMHRFIPVFAAWLGVRVAELPVNHRARVHGVAKYGLSRVSRVVFDLIVVRFFTDFMTRPIQFFGRAAKLAFNTGFCLLLGLLGVSLTGVFPVTPDTFLVLGSILIMACLQIILMGLTGELIIRDYFETQHKDHYVIERVLNL